MIAPGCDDALALLCGLLATGETRIAAASVGGRDTPMARTLIKTGLLIPDGTLATTICDACDHHHMADIVFDPKSGRHGWRCSEAGFVAADSDAIAALALGMAATSAALARTFSVHYGAGRWTSRAVEGDDVWVIGVWMIAGASTTVTLARHLDTSRAAVRIRERLAALPSNDAGLVLTVDDDAGFEPPPRFCALPLTLAVSLAEDGGLSVADELLRRTLRKIASAPLKLHMGRPGVEKLVFAVLDGLAMGGDLPDSRSGLAGIVGRAWPNYHPNIPCPQASTLRKHVRAWRSLAEAG